MKGIITKAQIEYICKELVADVGGHGDFLKAFARAYLRADYENRVILLPAAQVLISKYKLLELLPTDERALTE